MEDDDFESKSLEELEILLKHHLKDLEEYKDSDETAYEAAKEDIAAIKAAIAKIKNK